MAVNSTSPTKPIEIAKLRHWPWYIAPVAFFLLTVLFTWPLFPNFFSNTPRGLPDSYQDMWNFWWLRRSLFEHFTNPYYTDLLYYPYRNAAHPLPLYMHTLQPALSLPGGIIAAVTGIAASYNFILFVGFAGTGWAAYVLARYFLGKDKEVAAFLVGAFYTFSPFHQSSLTFGQAGNSWLQWIPLSILFLHKSLVLDSTTSAKSRNQKYLYPALAVLFFFLTFMTSWYFFMYLGIYAVGLYGFLLVRRANTQYNWKILTLRAVIIGGAVLVSISPLLLGLMRSLKDPDIALSGPIEEIEQVIQSSPVMSFFLRQENLLSGWRTNYLGYFLLALVGIFLLGSILNKQFRPLRWLGWWAIVTLVYVILSLGPYLRFFDNNDSLETIKSGLPLPYYFLQKLPFLNNARNSANFMSIGILGICLLAGGGFIWIQEKIKSRLIFRSKAQLATPVLAGLALILLVADFQALPLPLNQLYYPKILDQISNDADTSYALLELPITSHYTRDNRRMFFQSIHHHPINGGYISRRVIQFYDDFEPTGYFFSLKPAAPEQIFPNNPDVALKVLQLYNFRYVLVYRDESTPDQANSYLSNLDKILGKEARVFDDGTTVAYRVPDNSQLNPAVLVNTRGGYNAEKLADGRNYRWTDNQMDLQVVSNQNIEMALNFTAWSLAPENGVEIAVNSNKAQTLKLTQAPQTYSIKIKLDKGRNLINFKSLLPATTPQALGLPYSDNRKLAFALGEAYLEGPK